MFSAQTTGIPVGSSGIPVGVHREMLNFVLAITFDSGLRLGRSLYRWKALFELYVIICI